MTAQIGGPGGTLAVDEVEYVQRHLDGRSLCVVLPELTRGGR